MALRVDVDQCLASKASHRQADTAAPTTNFEIFSALDLRCANTSPPLYGAFTTCAGQPSHSVFWKLLEREASQPKNVAPTGLES